jgi:hypothetical protein
MEAMVLRLLILLMAAPVAAQRPAAVPELRIFAGGFPAGAWDVTAGAGPARRHMLADPSAMLFAGRTPGAGCRVTVVTDTPARAVVTWSCPGGDSGRSDIRRDHAGLYVVQAQGVSGRLPFATQSEFRHAGNGLGN